MSGHIVVGYTATDAGEDAVALGARLAAASGSELEVVVVLPADDRSVITPPDASYDRYLRGPGGGVAGGGSGRADPRRRRPSRTNVRFADSFAEGLVAAAARVRRVAHRRRCRQRRTARPPSARLGRHRAAALLGRARRARARRARAASTPSTGVTRITAAIGTRPGADALLEEATSLAEATGAELRLLSLVTVDLPRERRHRRHPHRRCRPRRPGAVAGARQHCPGVTEAEVVVGRGDSIEDAVAASQLGARRTGGRRLQPPRPAAAALPRLDRSEDAARTSRSHDRGAAHARRGRRAAMSDRMGAAAPLAPTAGRRAAGGLSKKGLSAGTVGLIGAVVIGISCIAPAYTLTAALGPTVSEVGLPGARDHPRRLHPDAAGRVRLPRAQPADARLRHLLHLGGARLRPVGRLDGRLGAHRRDDPRAVEPRRHRRRVPVPADRADHRQPRRSPTSRSTRSSTSRSACCSCSVRPSSRTATCRPRRSCSTSWSASRCSCS